MSDTTTTRPRIQWTPSDDLAITHNNGVGVAELAKQLGRTEQQIRARAKVLNVSVRKAGEKRGRKPKVQESA